MTSIKLKVTGAQAWAEVTGPLTSGMVGIPITMEYDDAWDGLTKNLVCRCSPLQADSGEDRTILDVGETAVVAHEVMQAGMILYLGIEGFRGDGTLVMPTVWAMCGKIQSGANTGTELSADPTLPVWEQLQAQIAQIKENQGSPDQAAQIQACVQSAVQAADTATGAADAAARAAQAAAVSAGRAEASAVRAENAADASQPTASGGLNETAANLLITILRGGVYSTDQSANITELEAALGVSGGGGAEEPDVPAEPDIPVEPDAPVEPDVPEEPDIPDVPVGGEDGDGVDILTDNLMGYYDMRTPLTDSDHIADLSGNGRELLFYPDNGYYADGVMYRGDKCSEWANPGVAYDITDGAAGQYAYGENVTVFITFLSSLAGTTPLVTLGQNPSTHKAILMFQKGIILYRQTGFNDVTAATKLTANAVTTVCAVITPTEEKIYFNGVLKSSSAAKTSEYGNAFRLLYGYSNSSADANTRIFNAAVYDAALTDAEIAEISATLLKNAGGAA